MSSIDEADVGKDGSSEFSGFSHVVFEAVKPQNRLCITATCTGKYMISETGYEYIGTSNVGVRKINKLTVSEWFELRRDIDASLIYTRGTPPHFSRGEYVRHQVSMIVMNAYLQRGKYQDERQKFDLFNVINVSQFLLPYEVCAVIQRYMIDTDRPQVSESDVNSYLSGAMLSSEYNGTVYTGSVYYTIHAEEAQKGGYIYTVSENNDMGIKNSLVYRRRGTDSFAIITSQYIILAVRAREIISFRYLGDHRRPHRLYTCMPSRHNFVKWSEMMEIVSDSADNQQEPIPHEALSVMSRPRIAWVRRHGVASSCLVNSGSLIDSTRYINL